MNLMWTKLSEEAYQAGYRRMLRRVYRLPDGRMESFDIRNEGQSVGILALTSDQSVVIARQYRPGLDRIVDDLPGGAVEADETPLDAARRELLEETGYAGEMREIGTCLEDGYSTKRRHNFVALHCEQIALAKPDKNEFIETVLMPMDDFRNLLRSGELTVVETGYLGLEALGLL